VKRHAQRRYLKNEGFQVRRKYAFKRELESMDGSCERAAIESLRYQSTVEQLAFPCGVGTACLFFANRCEARISCENWGKSNIR
jgi:hypothetical protein